MRLHILIIFSLLILIMGCDNIKCRPNVHPENKKGDWFAGFTCGGQW